MLTNIRIARRLWYILGLPMLGLAIGFVVDAFSLRQELLNARYTHLRQVVEVGYGVIEHFAGEAAAGRLSEEDAKAQAKAAIKRLRYDKVEYLWLNDLSQPVPRMVMHPMFPALDGTVLDDPKFTQAISERDLGSDVVESAEHKNLFVALNEVVTRAGAGYVTYEWPKPDFGTGSAQRYPKASYVQKFAPWGWVIGSGVYLDDVETAYQHELGRHGVWFLSLLAVVGGVCFLATRDLSAQFKALQSDINRIGRSDDGDCQLELEPARKDEFGRIAEILGEIVIHRQEAATLAAERGRAREQAEHERYTLQRNMLRSLVEAAILGNEAMIALSKMKYEIDQSAHEVQSMAEAVEAMRASISTISTDSTSAAGDAGDARRAADHGLESSHNMTAAFDRMVAAVNEAGSKVQGLAEASRQIDHIVTDIEAVASQTNLLALNATIEAARAGEAGKGFAVVAGEVKGLAHQTSRATEDVRARIVDLQQETQVIVQAINDSTDTVAEGQTLVGDLGTKLEDINIRIESVRGRMGDISSELGRQTDMAANLANGTARVADMSALNNTHLGEVLDAMGRMSQHLDSQVATYAKLGSGALLAEIAKNDHIAFKRPVLDGVLGRIKVTANDLPDHHLCRFGKWYDAIVEPSVKASPAYRDLLAPHEEVHRCGRRALVCAAEGRLPDAFAEIDKLNTVSQEVIARLETLGEMLHRMEEERLVSGEEGRRRA
ncbi:MAG TPA: methyl-accepting chemotaxis protein [Patescibacteria group bacterium]|nr:methyl-accepting chemotaxis protein [Patescibacteria group bacterium]